MRVIRKKSDYWLTCFFVLVTASLLTSCKSSALYRASVKFPAEDLQEDYRVMRRVLEKQHPALYWYTPKDSMDYFFDRYYGAITDSMTRQQFGYRVLAPLTTKIRCGHTSFSFPSRYNKINKRVAQPSFPLFLRVLPGLASDVDTMVVLSNLNKSDTVLKRGTLVTNINGLSARQLVDTVSQYMPVDGYSTGINYTRLSISFPRYHRDIFGLFSQYQVDYIDSTGVHKTAMVPLYMPADSANARPVREQSRSARPRDMKDPNKSLEIDSAHHLAVMNIHSFAGKNRLRSFYRKSFRKLRKENIPNLVIDLRSNGGGRVDNYTSLARYIKQEPFKVADSVVAVTNWLGNEKKYYTSGLVNSLILFFVSRKENEREYHFRYWERKTFTPRRKNHYSGKVYVLISGPTFSASTLFANAVKGQENVLLVGEEAGGGWHGNSGILIPDIILPNTKMKIRMPLHRIVQYKHVPKDGRGVMPDVFVPPTLENVRKGIDGKMMKVIELIQNGL